MYGKIGIFEKNIRIEPPPTKLCALQAFRHFWALTELNILHPGVFEGAGSTWEVCFKYLRVILWTTRIFAKPKLQNFG